jgi:hypothetical protein
MLFIKSACMKFSSEHHIASAFLILIFLLNVSLLRATSSLGSVQPILLLFQQPAFSYFDLFTNAKLCHGIKSVITPTNCEYECAKPCWVTHSPHLAPAADAVVFNLPEWADQSNATLVGPDPMLKGHQAWVLIHTESSQPDARRNYGQFLTSDVFMPPWELHMQLPLQMHLSDTDDVSPMRHRHDGVLAATWVSNCIASNNRTRLLQELMLSVPTHSFGQCLNNARMPPEMDWMGPFTSKERHVLRKDNWQVTVIDSDIMQFIFTLSLTNVENAARRRCQS